MSYEDVQAYLKIASDAVRKLKHSGLNQYFNEKDPKLLCFAPFNDDLA